MSIRQPGPRLRALRPVILGGLLLCFAACTFDTAGLEALNVNNVNNANNANNLNNLNNLNNTNAGNVNNANNTNAGNVNNVNNAICGDGLVTAPETCDDGNSTPDDGCAACANEAGWTCESEPSVCAPLCGDGLLVGPESCDDGNATPDDGCTACVTDQDWTCTGAPSVCRPGDWYHPAWSSRRTLTVPAGSVDADLADFPLLVHLAPEHLTGAQAGAGDVLFTLDDGVTKLAHEVLIHDPAVRGFWAFVKVPLLRATQDNVLYVYHGNPAAPAQQDPPAVWTAGFEAVLHLFEEGLGVDDEYVDSSGHGLHGTGGGIPGAGTRDRAPTRDTGVFGWSQRFPGETVNPSRAIHLRPLDDSTWNALTISVWMNPEDTGDQRVFGRTWGNGGADIVWLMGKTDKPKYRVRTVTNRVDENNGAAFPLNTWIHYAMVWQAAGAVSVYGNGMLLHNKNLAGDTLYVDDAEPIIGNSPLYPVDSRAFLGRIQEARVARVARTAAWLTAEADNQRDADAFHVVGVAQVF